MKKIGIFIFLLYAPSITCIFRIVQDSTLEALQIYENLDDVSEYNSDIQTLLTLLNQ